MKYNDEKTLIERFTVFNEENPQIYAAFSMEALKAIKMGKNKISAKLIIEHIRWNTFLTSNDDHFKINNNYVSYYARLFVKKNPMFSDVFNFRKLNNEESHPAIQVNSDGQLSFL